MACNICFHGCPYCGQTVGPFQVDHVVPRSRNGPDTYQNTLIACRRCNANKKDRLPSEWLENPPEAVLVIERAVLASMPELLPIPEMRVTIPRKNLRHAAARKAIVEHLKKHGLATVDTIAKELGVSPRTIYRHTARMGDVIVSGRGPGGGVALTHGET